MIDASGSEGCWVWGISQEARAGGSSASGACGGSRRRRARPPQAGAVRGGAGRNPASSFARADEHAAQHAGRGSRRRRQGRGRGRAACWTGGGRPCGCGQRCRPAHGELSRIGGAAAGAAAVRASRAAHRVRAGAPEGGGQPARRWARGRRHRPQRRRLGAGPSASWCGGRLRRRQAGAHGRARHHRAARLGPDAGGADGVWAVGRPARLERDGWRLAGVGALCDPGAARRGELRRARAAVQRQRSSGGGGSGQRAGPGFALAHGGAAAGDVEHQAVEEAGGAAAQQDPLGLPARGDGVALQGLPRGAAVEGRAGAQGRQGRLQVAPGSRAVRARRRPRQRGAPHPAPLTMAALWPHLPWLSVLGVALHTVATWPHPLLTRCS